jgi:competence CoiA-like predicted nuclease
VIAKCGQINVWHWAHKQADCDPWYEPESQWHREIKNWFSEDCQEVVMENHRADIWTGDDRPVIELQNSSISSSEIIEREQFYGKYIRSYPGCLIWIINGEKFEDNFSLRNKGGYYGFRWYHPRKTWDVSMGMIIIHFPKRNMFFQIKKQYNQMWSGWGVEIDKRQILRMAHNASI